MNRLLLTLALACAGCTRSGEGVGEPEPARTTAATAAPTREWTAASLRASKGGHWLYVPTAAATLPAGTAETLATLADGTRSLIKVATGAPARFALVTVAAGAVVDDRLAWPPPASARARLVAPRPFVFGGAATDTAGTVVAFIDVTTGRSLGVAADGQREKVEYVAGTLFVARLDDGTAVRFAQGRFDDAEAGAPNVHRGAAVWVELVEKAAQDRARVVYFVDSLVEPAYFGRDRPAQDGRYELLVELGSMTAGPSRKVGAYTLQP